MIERNPGPNRPTHSVLIGLHSGAGLPPGSSHWVDIRGKDGAIILKMQSPQLSDALRIAMLEQEQVIEARVRQQIQKEKEQSQTRLTIEAFKKRGIEITPNQLIEVMQEVNNGQI